LGIVLHLLVHNIIQLHIIARLFNKINPFFEKRRIFSKKIPGKIGLFCGKSKCQEFIFGKKSYCCEKHNSAKSRKKSKNGEKNYVNTPKRACYFFGGNGTVEKVVENVENSVQSMQNPVFVITGQKEFV